MNKKTEELKKQIEIEKQKTNEAEEIKKLQKELLRLQHKKAAKFADIAKEIPKMLANALVILGRGLKGTVEALNKMDEKVVELQRKERQQTKKQSKNKPRERTIEEDLNIIP